MPLRPLPLPYSVGIDICSIPRIRGLLLTERYNLREDFSAQYPGERAEKEGIPRRRVPYKEMNYLPRRTNEHLRVMSVHLNPNFLAKLLRPEEIASFRYSIYQRCSELPPAHDRLFEYIAGRWAAKEAIIKASSRFYRGQVENGQHRKPGFLDITIWSDKGIPKAAILSTPRKPSAERIASESEGFATQNNENRNALKGTAAMTIGDPSPESSADVLDYLQSLDGDIVEISISHERDYAVATALFCDPKARSDIELND